MRDRRALRLVSVPYGCVHNGTRITFRTDVSERDTALSCFESLSLAQCERKAVSNQAFETHFETRKKVFFILICLEGLILGHVNAKLFRNVILNGTVLNSINALLVLNGTLLNIVNALLVLNGTLLNSINALLVLNGTVLNTVNALLVLNGTVLNSVYKRPSGFQWNIVEQLLTPFWLSAN